MSYRAKRAGDAHETERKLEKVRTESINNTVPLNVSLLIAANITYLYVMDRDGWSGKLHECSLLINTLLRFHISV